MPRPRTIEWPDNSKICATSTPDTLELVAAAGFVWCADPLNSDNRYTVESRGRKVVVLTPTPTLGKISSGVAADFCNELSEKFK